MTERPITGRGGKIALAEGVLRVSISEPEVRECLRMAATEMFTNYPGSVFYCTVTANATLYSERDSTWSIWWGQQFGDSSGRKQAIQLGQEIDDEGNVMVEGTIFKLSSISDANKIPTSFPLSEFSQLFNLIHRDTSVVVHSLISTIFIFSKIIQRFDRDRKPQFAQKWTKLF